MELTGLGTMRWRMVIASAFVASCDCHRLMQSSKSPRQTLPSLARLRGGASVAETAANIFTDIVPAGMLPVASGLAVASSSLSPMTAHPAAIGVVAFFALIAHRTLVLTAEAIEASGATAPSLSQLASDRKSTV